MTSFILPVAIEDTKVKCSCGEMMLLKYIPEPDWYPNPISWWECEECGNLVEVTHNERSKVYGYFEQE